MLCCDFGGRWGGYRLGVEDIFVWLKIHSPFVYHSKCSGRDVDDTGVFLSFNVGCVLFSRDQG